MKICSANNICSIEILRRDPDDRYPGFEVFAQADLNQGEFCARNSDVHFLNLEEFVEDFDRFIVDRKLTPSLNGTYDTCLRFFQSGSMVVCEYRIGDAFSSRRVARFNQSGEFEIDQEGNSMMLRGFRQLVAQ